MQESRLRPAEGQQTFPGKQRFSQLQRQKTDTAITGAHYSTETVNALLGVAASNPEIQRQIDRAPEEDDGSKASVQLHDFLQDSRNRRIVQFFQRKQSKPSPEGPIFLNTLYIDWKLEALLMQLAEEYRENKSSMIKLLIEFALQEMGYDEEKKAEILKPYNEYLELTKKEKS